MTFLRRSILLCALAVGLSSWVRAAAAPASAPPAMVAGAIKAANVRGDVKKVNLVDKSEVALANGDTLIHENAVVTGTGESSAVLVFSNGSTVRVGHESRLEIKEFLIDPLNADVPNVAALSREPTSSRTQLRLEFGEVVGNVKTLNRAAGSNFSVSTPAGAAGIRGTTFRIVYRPTGDGRAFNYGLSASEGVVLWEGTTEAGATSVSVPVGQEIVVVARVDPATNTLVVSAPTPLPGIPFGTTPISVGATAALQTATVQIIQTQQQTTFSQVDVQRAQQQLQQQQQQQAQPGQPQAQPQAQPPAPPPPPTVTPRITTPDGRL